MTFKQDSKISKNDQDIQGAFNIVNEREVDDISLEFFYKPHTITLLATSIAAVVYSSFIRNEQDFNSNLRAGVYCVFFFFIIISVLTFPNGPFTRPHPVIWRIVFGLSVLYLFFLVFCLFQNYKTVKQVIYWFYPELEHFHLDLKREQYGVNCSVITIENLSHYADIFTFGHFFGWTVKALLIRHLGILWAISIMWEFTEIAFAHLLPNFVECWWDALILDVLVCNGLGIWFGLWICKKLEMREYKWVSIRDIHSTTGKLKRAVMQFTPRDWMKVRWFDPSVTSKRFFAICLLVVVWQVLELNTFFIKHIFEMPSSHPLVVLRAIFMLMITAPSARQYYVYITDPLCKRVGSQFWVYVAIIPLEALLCLKNGKELFGKTQIINISIWILVMLLLSCICVYSCVLWHKYFQTENNICQVTAPCISSSSDTSNTLLEPEVPATKKESLLNTTKDVKRRHINGTNA